MQPSTRSEEYEDKSYWLGAEPYTENPPLDTERTADVVVVGGGFTGLSAAHFLKRARPALEVVLLESEVIGFGASGRNAGFSMTLFGLSLPVTVALYGKARAAEAHRYMEQAVELVESLIREHHIECDYERPGFLRVATSPAFARRVQREVELAQEMGLEGIHWLDAGQVRAEVDSPLYLGAWSEPRCGLLNPAALARGMKKVIELQGVRVYERTPCTRVERDQDGIVVHTPHGSVRGQRLVLATNAWSGQVPELRRKQAPVFTHIVLSEPLAPERLARIGWRNRQGIEDARNLVHYYRLTRDNRILMGGRDVTLAFGDHMDRDLNPSVFEALEKDVQATFPALGPLSFTHRWGGPVSVPVQMVPALGRLGDERTVFALGCMGHGVSLSHMNGWTLADLVLDQETERTAQFFVNRRILPWPPEPLRMAVSLAIRGYLRAEDRWNERGLATDRPSGSAAGV